MQLQYATIIFIANILGLFILIPVINLYGNMCNHHFQINTFYIKLVHKSYALPSPIHYLTKPYSISSKLM